jgi:pimeloyl-ACP methyl ester carboxylesterase
VGLLAAAGVLRLALAWERRLHTSWLLRIYRFAHLRSVDRVAGLDQRVDGLAAALDAHLRDPSVQEVLLVGFSVGSLLAVSAAARARGQDGPAAGKLALLTLGHCVPMLGLMPKAERFRAELARLAHAEGVTWLDFSSPTDWGSFALVDPVGLCLGEAAAPPGRRRFASPRFHCLFSPAAYRRLRRNKRRMHLQYLMAGERAGDYDYFALTAGPLSLRARYDQGCAG